jgi:hypothetical protein
LLRKRQSGPGSPGAPEERCSPGPDRGQKRSSYLVIQDEGELNNLTTAFRTHFNQNTEMRKTIGGFKKGAKSQIKYDKLQAVKEKEAIRKLQ